MDTVMAVDSAGSRLPSTHDLSAVAGVVPFSLSRYAPAILLELHIPTGRRGLGNPGVGVLKGARWRFL